MKNKKAISLIVLVITIIVMGILASVVIISLSNTNVIENAQNSVNKYNKSTIAQAIQLEETNYVLENKGEEPTTFELIDIIADKGIITADQKKEMLQNNGKLKIGSESYEIDKSSIFNISTECVSETGGYRFRFIIELLKEREDIEYTEYGFIYIASAKYTLTEGTMDENFTFEGAEKYGVTWGALNSNSSSFKLINGDNPDVYTYVLALVNMSEELTNSKVMLRGYVKYVKDGIEGIMYSDIAEYCCNDVRK